MTLVSLEPTSAPVSEDRPRHQDEPTLSGPRPPRRITGEQRTARRLALAVLTVGLLLATSGLGEWATTSRDLEEARTDQHAAEHQLATTSAELVEVQQGIDAIRGRGDRDTRAADAASHAADDLAALRAQMITGQAALGWATAQAANQQGQLDVLASCIDSLDRAQGQLAAGQAGAANVALRSGVASCQFAEALVKGPATASFPYDFADPFVMPGGRGYLAFGTNGAGGLIQTLTSTDGAHWDLQGSALAGLPGWAAPGHTWAPSVMVTPFGWVMLYTAHDRRSGKQCISTARAADPSGPYVDTSTGPFICQTDLGGSIDASPTWAVDGTAYIVWKSEGEAAHSVSRIWSQQLDPVTFALLGAPTLLLSADRAWEDRVIEGPSMAVVDGVYTLLYSGNHWGEPEYATAYATCAGPLGPCTKPADNIVISSNDQVAGPGGAEFFPTPDGGHAVAFAGWSPDSIGWPSPRRLWIRHVQPAPPGRLVIR